jgi:hypothetical protein
VGVQCHRDYSNLLAHAHIPSAHRFRRSRQITPCPITRSILDVAFKIDPLGYIPPKTPLIINFASFISSCVIMWDLPGYRFFVTCAPIDSRITAESLTRAQCTCGSGSPEPKNAGIPSKLPPWVSFDPGGPTSPPVKAISPPYRLGNLATNSVDRHAPCENPQITIFSTGTPSSCAIFTTAPTRASAELRKGSFASIGAKNDSGYQLCPAASGARNASPGK